MLDWQPEFVSMRSESMADIDRRLWRLFASLIASHRIASHRIAIETNHIALHWIRSDWIALLTLTRQGRQGRANYLRVDYKRRTQKTYKEQTALGQGFWNVACHSLNCRDSSVWHAMRNEDGRNKLVAKFMSRLITCNLIWQIIKDINI